MNAVAREEFTPALQLRGYGVAFNDRVILASVDLELQPGGVLVLMGPSGSGKSTLLRSLAGVLSAQPAFRSWGSARCAGKELGDAPRPGLLRQKASLLTTHVHEFMVSGLESRGSLTRLEQRAVVERALTQHQLENFATPDDLVIELPVPIQRRLAIVRLALNRPPLLCVDEVLVGLSPEDARPVIELMRQVAKEAALLVITHHQGHAKALGDEVALLAGGGIVARQPAREFFEAPANDIVADYVRTGGCRLPSPSTRREELAEDAPTATPLPPIATRLVTKRSKTAGPSGFHWLLPQQLGGTPRPGLLSSADSDLDALKALGVDLLVSLEETPTVATDAARARAIDVWHTPIVDMQPPGLEVARELTQRMHAALEQGRTLAVHCRAGLGRTGTLLVAYLISRGESAVAALERARAINPLWVQSESQIEFLFELDRMLNR